jgi:hypothetical protein
MWWREVAAGIEMEGQVIAEGALRSRMTAATDNLEHGLSRRETQPQVRGMPLSRQGDEGAEGEPAAE